MHKNIFTILFSSFLLSVTPALSADNLMPNGGFEQDGTGWNLFLNNAATATATMSFPTTGAQEGTKFCRVSVSKISSNAADNWFIQLQNPTWTAKKGAEYHLTFWAKADAPHTVQLAIAGDSISPYTYRAGNEIGVGTTWKQYELYHVSDVSGSGRMSFNFYCGYATGAYDFDNVVLTEYTSNRPSTMTIPAKGAWESGVHRNLFAEMGYAQADIDAKVNAAFQQLFFGDRSAEAVYTPVGTDMGYVNTPDAGSIITEGQSYGMIIAVMMNRQDIFDRLWRFAKTYMQHQSGDRKGYFAWNIKETAPYAMNDPNPAPDGEEYFVTSLFFAAKRWGNGAGILNYQSQADSILTQMLHKPTNSSVMAMVDSNHSMVVFSPVVGWSPTITDASYHLPGFYKIWSQFATNDKALLAKMADSSRAFFKRACNATTGLMADLQNWDGSIYVNSSYNLSKYYHSDAWRTPMNIGFDYAWFAADPWEVEQSIRLMKFFTAQGDYKQLYTVDGQLVAGDANSTYSAAGGQTACNAVSALACTDTVGWKFVEALWKASTPSGTYRYYSGLLHMMGLLHCSGKFKIYGNTGLGVIDKNTTRAQEMSTFHAQGMIEITDIAGRLVARFDAGLGLSLNSRQGTIGLESAKLHVPVGVYSVKFQANGRTITQKLILVK